MDRRLTSEVRDEGGEVVIEPACDLVAPKHLASPLPDYVEVLAAHAERLRADAHVARPRQRRGGVLHRLTERRATVALAVVRLADVEMRVEVYDADLASAED